MINDDQYIGLLSNSIEKLNEKKKFTKSYKMSKALLDIEYFETYSWLEKSYSEKQLIKSVQSKQTLLECLNNLRCLNSNITYQLGDRELMLGNLEQSLLYFQKYLQYNPASKKTQIQIARLQFRLGNISDAETRAQQFLDAHNAAIVGNADGDGQFGIDDELDEVSLLVLYSLMVSIQYTLKNEDKLIDYVNRILNLQPNDTFALIYLADFLMNYPDKREHAISQIKILRQRIYNERIDFTKQTFQDLINILEKYDDIILRE